MSCESLVFPTNPGTNKFGDSVRGFQRILVLPNLDRQPVCFYQAAAGIGVSTPICFDLIPPKSGVGFRPSSVNRAPMPETAVNIDRNARLGKDDVGACSHSRYWFAVDSVPKAKAMKRRPKGDFGRGVALPRGFHAAPGCL